MILTREYLKQYQKNIKISIPDDFEKKLLDEFGHPVTDDEGHIFEYSEQDIYEQVRKALQMYLEGGV